MGKSCKISFNHSQEINQFKANDNMQERKKNENSLTCAETYKIGELWKPSDLPQAIGICIDTHGNLVQDDMKDGNSRHILLNEA